MYPTRFAFIAGIIFLITGLASFMFPGSAENLPVLEVNQSYGLFLNQVPLNIFNKIALIIFGLGGIRAANDKFASLPLSIFYSRIVFYAMGGLAILGLIPQTNTLFGYWPLFGRDIWFHGLFAVLGGYFGYALKAKLNDRSKDFTTPAHGL